MLGQPRIQIAGASLEHRGEGGLDQVGLVPEVIIEVRLGHPDQSGDIAHRHGFVAALGEKPGGGFE